MEQIVKDNIYHQYTGTNFEKDELAFGRLLDKKIIGMSDEYINKILNIKNCTYGTLKNYWCNYYNIPYQYKFNDVIFDLTYKELQLVVFLVNFKNTQLLNLANLEIFLDSCSEYFGMNIKVVDNNNMTITYFFQDYLNSYYLEYLKQLDILPRPVGVLVEIFELGRKYMGMVDDGETFANTSKVWLSKMVDDDEDDGSHIMDNGEYTI